MVSSLTVTTFVYIPATIVAADKMVIVVVMVRFMTVVVVAMVRFW